MHLPSILIAIFLITFMHAGSALLETGLSRAKNAAHAMSVSFLVYALSITGFFVCGYAIMCGGGFFIRGIDSDSAVRFLFFAAVISIAVKIPTGALAERWSFKSFFLFSLVTSAFLYPLFARWVWCDGWLANLGSKFNLGHGAVDFAGSGVIHLQGGALALIACIMLGPRIGKYDEHGNPKPIFGHNVPMVTLGAFILAFGWFGLTLGSAFAAGDAPLGMIALNTMLASASAATFAAIYVWMRFGKPDPTMMCNGMLGGLVAISAPCAFVAPWAAFLIGAIAGVLVIWSIFFFERSGIDDPVGVISMHGIGGIWGLLALGLFADGTYGIGFNNITSHAVTGLCYGDPRQLLAQLIEIIACIAWNVIVGGLIFWSIGKLLGRNRVPPEVEIAGLDIPEMGAPGYPEFINAMGPEQIHPSEFGSKSTYAMR
jgi:Amt family ammonium transporter